MRAVSEKNLSEIAGPPARIFAQGMEVGLRLSVPPAEKSNHRLYFALFSEGASGPTLREVFHYTPRYEHQAATSVVRHCSYAKSCKSLCENQNRDGVCAGSPTQGLILYIGSSRQWPVAFNGISNGRECRARSVCVCRFSPLHQSAGVRFLTYSSKSYDSPAGLYDGM